MRARILLYAIPLLGFFVPASLGAAMAPDGQARRIIFKNSTNDNIHVSYHPQRGGLSIRRILAPRTVLMVRGDIDSILWNTEGPFLAGKTNSLSFPRAPYTLISFENGKASIKGCNRLQDCGGDELRARGVNDLLSVFPALETRQKAVSWFLRTLPGFRPVYGFKNYPEVEAFIRSKRLDQHVAARYILGLPEYPLHQEIDHAVKEYERDILETSELITGRPTISIDDNIEYALSESQHLLSERAKEPGYAEKVQAAITQRTYTFKNETNQSVHLAAYFVEESNEAQIAPQTLTEVRPGEQRAITAPPISGRRITTGTRRRILATFDRSQLQDYLSEQDYFALPNIDVDVWNPIFKTPSLIYLIQDNITSNLNILSTFEYGKERETAYDLEHELEGIEAQQNIGSLKNQAYFNQVDQHFLRSRLPVVKHAFENLLRISNIPNNAVPRVGIAFTGGGPRAMIETLGYLTAASEINVNGNAPLIDCISYMAGLSGSTWALSALLDAKLQTPPQHFSYRGVTANLQQRMVQDLMSMYPNKAEKKLLHHIYSIKNALRMPSDYWLHMWYGFILAKTVLSGDEKSRQMRRLSDFKTTVLNGSMPLPILTAISAYPKAAEKITSFELSPLLVGTHQHGGKWINTEFFGRAFDRGQTIHSFGMEEYLSYLMAICGSAYAAGIRDIRDAIASGIHGIIPEGLSPVVNAMKSMTHLTPDWLNSWFDTALDARLTRPKEFNFTFGSPNPIGDQREVIHLVDGAHNILTYDGRKIINNFAAVPLLSRNVDLLILSDCTNTMSADHFVAAALRARELGLPFPDKDLKRTALKIENNMRSNQPTLIVDENNLNAPVIVILATMKDATYKDANFDPTRVTFTGTFNFQYQPHQFAQLQGLSEHSMIKAIPVIKRALELAYTRRQQRIGGLPGAAPAQAP